MDYTFGSEISGGNFKIPRSEAEILNFRGTRKDWDSGPLTCKFANGCQVVIQGQGCFTKHGLPWVILAVESKGYKECVTGS